MQKYITSSLQAHSHSVCKSKRQIKSIIRRAPLSCSTSKARIGADVVVVATTTTAMAQSSNGISSVVPAELLADGKVIGAKVRVLTQADESFDGVIFTLDPVASFLILGAFIRVFVCVTMRFACAEQVVSLSLSLSSCAVGMLLCICGAFRGARCRWQGQDAHAPARCAQEDRGMRSTCSLARDERGAHTPMCSH